MFLLIGDVAFPEYFFVRFLFGWRVRSTTVRDVLSFRMVFFFLVTTSWIFYISLLCENSINKKNQKEMPGTNFFFPCSSADHERDWPPCKERNNVLTFFPLTIGDAQKVYRYSRCVQIFLSKQGQKLVYVTRLQSMTGVSF